MALNESLKDSIEYRKEQVASMRLRGLSLDEISVSLHAKGIYNKKKNAPYVKATIKNDLDAMKEEWRKNAGVDTNEHRSRQYAEIQEIKRFAWSNKDGSLALSALDKEMKLLGTLQTNINININIELVQRVITTIERAGLNPSDVFEELMNEIALVSTTDSA